MPSPTLEKIRKQFPDLDNISDNELTVRIGNKYPKLLEKDNQLASEFTDLTEFTVGGAASQVYQKTTKGAPMLLGKIGWGVAEGFTAPILGDYSAADLGVFGLVKTASKFFGNEVDITGAINRYSKSLSDEADNQLRKINEGGLVTSYGGIVSSGFGLLGAATETYYEGTEAEMPTEWERRLGNVAQTTATLVPTIAAAPGGTPAVLAAAGLTTFGSTFQESRRAWEDAGDPDANRKAFATATVDGLKTAAITYTGMKFAQKLGLSDVDKLAGLKGDKVFASGMGNFLKRVGLGAPIEGVEEGIDEALSSAIATVTYNPNADIKEAFAEAFFAGALIGGATGSIEGYSQYSAAKKEARELADKGLPKTADKILLNAQRKWESRNKPDDEIIPLPDDPSQAPDEVVGVDSEGRPTREVKPTVTTTDDLDAENVPEIKISSNVDAQIEAAEAEANRIAETGEAEVTTEAPTEPEAPAESTREEIEDEWKKSARKSGLKHLGDEVIDKRAKEYADGVLAERAKAATPDPTPAETPVETPAATTPAAGTQQDLIGEATQDEVDELIDHEFYTELGLTPVTPLADPDSIKSRMTKEQQEYFEEELEEQKQSLGSKYESQSAKDNWNNSGVFERRKDLSRRGTPQPEATTAPQEAVAQPTQEEVVDQQEGTITEEQSESLAAKLTKLAQASNRMKSKGKFLWDERRGGKGNKGASKTNKPKNPDKLQEFENELASIANETGVTVESLREKIKDLVFQRALETKTTGKGKQLNKDRTKAEIEFLKLPEGETDVLDDFIDTVGGKIDVPVGKDKKVIVKGDSKQKLPADYDGIDNFATAVNDLSRTQPSVAGDLINRVPASEVKSPIDDYAKTIGVETSQFWDLMADAINRRIELNRIKQEQKAKKPLQEVLTKKDKSKKETQLSEINEKDTFVVDGVTYTVEGRFDEDTSTTLVVAPYGSREYTSIKLTEEDLLYLEDFQPTETSSQEFGDTVVSTSENNSPSDVPYASVPNEIVNGVRIAKPANKAQENVLTRVAALIPKIQRKLGGAKLRNIFVSTDNNQPAFSGARGGDFGSVYLNPEVIIELERQGKGDLERILIEEIIHNYNGLALYREWDATGRVDSFQTFYERKMTEVFLEMSKGEIAETSFWYGNQIDGDAVAIAEEFLRIALQRKLTGSINEDLFGRKVQQKGALGKLMDILAKFWNGIKRGSMGNSSRINTLKKRIRLMMNDQRVSFPAIDGARLTFTAAAGSEFVQNEFQLEGEQSPERFVQISHREYEEEVHEENSFDNNTGDFLGALFAKSRLDLKKLNREASLNAKGASTIPAIDAAFIQPQVFETIPLPEEFIVNTYATIHKTLAKDQTLSDSQKDQAMMYVLSRATNDARRFLVKNKRWQDASEALLGGEKGDYSLSSLIRTRLIDYRNMSRSLGQKLVKSGDGLVSLDMPVELTEESTETTVGDLVPNPFTLTPSQELINDELLNYIQEAEVSLTSSEKDLLSFGFQENFKHGWLSAYAKSRGTGRSAAKMQWNKVSDTMALALASKKDLDVQVGREIPPRLVDKIAKVQAAYDILSEQRKEKVSAEEKSRIQQNIRKLIDKQTKPAEDVEEQRTGVRSVEVTREGEVIAGDFDITNANIRKQLNLPPLERDSEGRIINEPRDSSVLEEPLPRKRKIVAASLPPEFLEEVSDKAEDITAEEARNYRATDDVKNDDSINATDSRRDEVKERMAAAAEDTSKWYDPFVDTASALKLAVKRMSRQFENLDPSKHGHTVEILRQFQATTELSQTKARENLRAIVNGLTPEQFDFFTKVLVYRDLQQSIKNGLYQKNKDLPFGFQDAAEVDFLLQESEADLLKPENQKIRDAIQRRKVILEDLTKQMQKRKLLPKDITDAENYFHRITLEYRDATYTEDAEIKDLASKILNSTSKTDVRTKRAGFQRKRKGSEKDYSTDFLESENEVLAQGYAQIQTHDTLVRLEGVLNQKAQLKAQAKASNEKELVKVVPLGDLETFFKPFNSQIAIAFSKLQGLLNKRQINYAPHFQEVAESLEEGTQHPDTFAFLSHLMETEANGAGYAGMIFKNVKAKESAIENALGDKYETWKTLTDKNPKLKRWQPVEGNFLYKGTVASDQALLKWFEEASKGDTATIKKEDLRKQLVLGGKRDEWAIPIEVAAQLNSLEADKESGPVAAAAKMVTGGGLAQWKFWKLFNPIGFLKYEINNLTGDFDVAFAYDPKIITQYSKQAYQDLYDFHVNKKPLTKDMEDLLQKGVLGSGYMLQDLTEMKPEVAVDALFTDFVDGLKKKSSWLKDFTGGYKRKVATINQVREDTLRLAAYRYFQDRLGTSDNVFGASKKSELALIPNKKDKAAKMARELLGDYGAISTGGRWLRKYMMPFWSWMEINAPRYVRMMKNAHLEDRSGTKARVAGAAAKSLAVKGVTQTVKFGVLASTLPLFVNMFNRFMIEAGFVDEEDKRVVDARNQQHLLLYSTEEGRVISVKMQGALTDALEWLGLGSMYATATDVALTDDTLAEASQEYLTQGELAKGWINRLAGSTSPLYKVPAEVIFKQSIFPDLFKASPMRDRTAYLLQNLELGWASMGVNAIYKLGQNFPSKGITGSGDITSSLWQFVGYTTDTGQSAYSYIKAKEYDFYNEKEGDRGGFTTSNKSDALYYHKKAKKWGDESSAEAWKEKYFELGGTKAGMKRSITSSKPLAKIKKYRSEFLRTLTDYEKEILERAQKWYKETNK